MFKWDNYLNLAKEIALKDGEEFKRSAISRAYYSAFHNTRLFLEQKGLSYTKQDHVHSFVWDTIGKLPGEAKKISAKEDRLKYRRAQADYDNELSGLNGLTNASIQDAEYINNTIKKMSN